MKADGLGVHPAPTEKSPAVTWASVDHGSFPFKGDSDCA